MKPLKQQQLKYNLHHQLYRVVEYDLFIKPSSQKSLSKVDFAKNEMLKINDKLISDCARLM